MKKSFFWMACLGVCALALAACGKEKRCAADADENAEKPCDDCEKQPLEQVAEAQIEAQIEEPAEPIEKQFPAVCFYTEKGGKWHTDIDCRYLKNSAEIRESSVDGARYAGKNQPCSVCAAAYIGE